MANRTRKNQFPIYLSDKEMLAPDAKMEIAKKRSETDLIRQLIMEGQDHYMDYACPREYDTGLWRIRENINQIERNANETNSICKKDIEEAKGEMEKIWKSQKAKRKAAPFPWMSSSITQ